MAQRLLAAALVTVQVAVLGYFTGTVSLPVLLAATAWLAAVRRHSWLVSPRQLFYAVVLVVLFVALKHLAAPYQFDWSTTMVNSDLSYSFGLAAILFQLLPLVVRLAPSSSGALPGAPSLAASDSETSGPLSEPVRHAAGPRLRRLPLWLPFAGVFALVCFGDIRLDPISRWVFQAAAVSFVLLAGLYCSSCRRYVDQLTPKRSSVRLVTTAVVLFLAGVVAWTVTTAIYVYEPEISRWLIRLSQSWFMDRLTGFSGVANLQSLTARKESRAIVLRVQSIEPPGYLRGKAFDFFTESRWEVRVQSNLPTPVYVPPEIREKSKAPGALRGVLQYGLSDADSVNWHLLDVYRVWQDDTLAGRFFTPLGTRVLLTADDYLQVDEHGIFRGVGRHADLPYVVLARRGLPYRPLSDSLRQQLLQIPSDLDPRIRTLADRLFANCRTPREKIRAVVNFFHTQFRYSLKMRLPKGADPVTYFLLSRPPAHCEFFATGATLLLRLAGVPCRYVCGFVAHERNSLADYWVVRNCDAHAWVEAFVDGESWVLVDPTPPEGVPSGPDEHSLAHLVDFVRWRLRQFRLRLQREKLRPLAELLAALVPTDRAWLIVALAVAVSLATRLRRRRRQALVYRNSDVPSPLPRLLAKADRFAQRWELVREPAETLDHFAERVEQRDELRPLAEWYRHYAAVRYGGQWNDGEVEQLSRELTQCQRLCLVHRRKEVRSEQRSALSSAT